ncbi:unnamed protein product [Diamesa hyperborea]
MLANLKRIPVGLHYGATKLYSNIASVKVSEQKVKVGSNEINYVKSELQNGIEKKKSLVLLPGALGSALTDFKPQIHNLPVLLPEYSIIAWDPIGYGKSIPPKKEFSVDFLEKDADILKNMMEVLNVRKYSLLGWSDGGISALCLAGKYSENIDKLIIFGSNAYIISKELEIYDSIRDISKWSPKMREPLEKLYGAEYFKDTWEKWVDTFKLIYKEKNGDLCKEHLKNIKAPTLILHGEKDPMIASEHVPYLLKNIAGSKLITWPNGKHNIHLRYADEFNKKVAEFLSN